MKYEKETYYSGIMSHDIGYNPNLLKHFHTGISVSFTGIRNVFYIYIFR